MVNFFSQFDVNSFLSLVFNSNLYIIYLVNISIFIFIYSSYLIINPFNIFWFSAGSNIVSTINNSMGMGSKSRGYRILILTLFLLILCLNILGMFPYVFSYSSHISITIGFSLLIVISCYFYSLYYEGMDYFSHFTPVKTPLGLGVFLVIVETISSLARILSLGLRLAANITAGHLLLAMLSSFTVKGLLSLCPLILGSIVPLLVIIKLFVIILEIAIAFVQAYVFVLLTTLFITDTTAKCLFSS